MRVDKGFLISHGLVGRVYRIQDSAGLLQGQGVSRKSGGVVCVLYLELPLLLESFLQGDGGLCLFQLLFLLL